MDLSQWDTELRTLVLLVLVSLAGGILFHSYLLAFSIGLLVITLWYLSRLLRMSRILAAGGSLSLDKHSGLLQRLSLQISNLQRKVDEQERYNTRVVSLFRKAFEVFPDAVMILRSNWQIQWCNETGKQMFGLESETERYGSLVDEVGHPVLLEYLKAGDFSRPLQLESPTDLAKIMSIQLTTYPKDDGLVLLVARDITRLYHLDQMRKDFVANVSHELRTPLTVISGYLESMHVEGEDIPEHWAHAIELMFQQSERMKSIVDDLLMLSRLDAGQEDFTPQMVDVPSLLEKVVVDAQILAQESGHTITLEIEPSLRLMGEWKTLESLFYNIVMNAVHHTPAGSRVDIHWFRESGMALLKVVDTGDGIPARHLPHLTEPFYRVDAGRSRDSGGTGLGLSIVNRAVLRHRGRLQITSEVGRGSVVVCEFPEDLSCNLDCEGAVVG
jgi:two-component system, OmpR family, phosphate regulon sensor histidine kinase PhoR